MKSYTKSQIEQLVLKNFWEEVERAEKSNDRREDYISQCEHAGKVWSDFDYLPEDLTFFDLLDLKGE
tara:strand:- start:290 stop:490 length:201 start_codon:yes stop_codon:yes gene_type:complete